MNIGAERELNRTLAFLHGASLVMLDGLGVGDAPLLFFFWYMGRGVVPVPVFFELASLFFFCFFLLDRSRGVNELGSPPRARVCV
jgi:hypothetical protein